MGYHMAVISIVLLSVRQARTGALGTTQFVFQGQEGETKEISRIHGICLSQDELVESANRNSQA